MNDVVELPAVGKAFKKGESFATVESVKAASDVYSPVDATIVAVNAILKEGDDFELAGFEFGQLGFNAGDAFFDTFFGFALGVAGLGFEAARRVPPQQARLCVLRESDRRRRGRGRDRRMRARRGPFADLRRTLRESVRSDGEVLRLVSLQSMELCRGNAEFWPSVWRGQLVLKDAK